MKIISVIFVFFLQILVFQSVNSQTYLMNQASQIQNDCSAIIQDSGGNNNYTDNENRILTICKDNTAGMCGVQLMFTSFALENNFDDLAIYDGPNTSSTLIGSFTGTSSPGTIVSTGNCITLWFTTDGSVTFAGFSATVSCTPCPLPCTSEPCTGSPPPNDNCSSAQSLGSLPAPPACNGSTSILQGAPISIIGSNVCATAGSPYNYLTGCNGGLDMASPAADVWYSFTATANETIIDLTNAFNSISLGVYEAVGGNCSNLIGRGCVVSGTTASLIVATAPNQLYFIQISGGDELEQCGFNMSIKNRNDCSQCLLAAEMFSISPLPVNGVYNAGQSVNFCYRVNSYNQTTANWLHGVVPTFGPGWSNIGPVGQPQDCNGASSNPNEKWVWVNSVTSTNSGLTVGPGWFYETSQGGVTPASNPPLPGNNWGDANPNNNCVWTFCFQATVGNCPPLSNGDELNLSIETYGDSETGSWTSEACEEDPVYTFSAEINCCVSVPATISGPTQLCNTDDPIQLTTASPGGTWSVTTGLTPGPNGTATFNPAGLTGNSTITYSFGGSCSSSDQHVINVIPEQSPVLGTATLCINDTLFLNTIDDNAILGTWSGDGISGPPMIFTTSTSGNYVLNYTTAGLCVTDESTTIIVTEPLIPELSDPQPFCGNGTNINLSPFGDPALPGNWSGTGVNGTSFNPQGQIGNFTITYTPISDCAIPSDIDLTILPVPQLVTGLSTCLSTDVYSIIINLNGDPSTTFVLSGSAVTGTNPSVMNGNSTATFELNIADAPFTLVAENPSLSLCSSTLNIAAPVCECPAPQSFANGNFNFCQDASSIDLSIGGETGLGQPTGNLAALNTDDADGDGYDWFDNPDPQIGDTPYDLGNLVSTDPCVSNIYQLYAFMRCSSADGTFDGGVDDQYIDAGSISIEIFPDITDLTISIIGDGTCCPYVSTYECESTPGYSISNDFDGNGSTPDCTLEEGVGVINWQVINSNLPPELFGLCGSPSTSASYDCIDLSVCPTIENPIAYTQYFCGEGIPNLDPGFLGLVVDDPEFTMSGFYITYDEDDPPQLFYDNELLESADNCVPGEYTLYAYITCDFDFDFVDDLWIPAGEINIVVYPDISNLEYELDTSDPCCPKIEVYDCMLYNGFHIINTSGGSLGTPDCDALNGSGDITFVISQDVPNSLANSPCQKKIVTVPYNCADCPQPTPIAGNFDYCYNDNLLLSAIIADQNITIEYPAPTSPTIVTEHYYLTDGIIPSDEILLTDNLSIGSSICDPTQHTVYAYLLCDLNGDGFTGGADDSYVAAGSVGVNVFPDLTLMNYTVQNEGDCCPSIVEWDCSAIAGFSFTNSLDPNNNLSPDCSVLEPQSGTLEWTVTNSSFPANCNSATFQVPFSCTCPSSTEPGFEDAVCTNTTPDLLQWEAEIIANISDPQNHAQGDPIELFWFTNAGLSTPYLDTPLANNSDNCNSITTTLYAAMICVLNNDYIAVGSVDIAIYPDYDEALISIQDNGCDSPTISVPTCSNYIITESLNPGTLDPGQNNTATWTITYNSNTNCFEEPYSVPYSCPPLGCPTNIVPYNDEFEICSLDNPTIDLVSNVSFDNPDNQAGTLGLYTDAGFTNQFNNDFSYSGNGCLPEIFTLYIGLPCLLNGSIQAAGQIEITIYPTSADLLLINSTPGDCNTLPTAESNCPNYMLTPVAGTVPATPGGSGTASWTVEYVDGSLSCFTQTIDVSYDCIIIPENCPSIATPLNLTNSICQGGTIDFASIENSIIIDDPDGNAGAISWFNETVNTTFNTTTDLLEYIGNNCDPYLLTLSLSLACNLPNEPAINAGQVVVTIYPNYDEDFISSNPVNCVIPSITTGCANYTITPISVPSSLEPGDPAGTATWSISSVNGSCIDEIYEVDYACPAIPCPTISSTTEDNQNICTDTDISNFLQDIEDAAFALIDDPSDQFGEFIWFTNLSLTNDYDPNNYVIENNDCNSITQSIYLGFTCDQGGATVMAGSLTLNILPDFNSSFVDSSDGNCEQLPSLEITCDQYEITDSNVPSIINPGDSGTAEWTISYLNSTENCFEQVITASYSCPANGCPSISNELNETIAICNGATVDLDAFADEVIIEDPDLQSGGLAWYSDASHNNLFDPASLTSNVDICALNSVTIYLGLLCNLDQSILSAGTLEVSIYPNLNDMDYTITNDGGCCPVLEWICAGNSNFTITNSYDNNGVSPACQGLGNNGAVTWNIAYTNPPLNLIVSCITATIDGSYNCSNCTVLNADITAPEPLCNDGASLDLNTLLTVNTTQGGTWTSDDLLGINNSIVTLSASVAPSNYQITYTVYPPATDPDGCLSVNNTVTLQINEPPVAVVTAQSVLCNTTEGGSTLNLMDLIQNGDTSGQWVDNNNSGAGILPGLDFNNIEPGNYSYTYTTATALDPCEEHSYTTTVIVNDCRTNQYFIPSAFSPNGDLYNDVFRIFGANILNAELHIYDRWGKKYFSSSTFGEGWDGTYDGQTCEVAVYVYWAKITYNDGAQVESQGNVTLIR